MEVVLDAVQDTINALSSLYGIKSPIELHLADDNLEPDLEYYSLPARAAFSRVCAVLQPSVVFRVSTQPEAIPRPTDRKESNATIRNSLRFILNNVFRCQEFLEDQAELIEQILSLGGTIGLLKPGGGKTLAYQLASILQPGIALVVVPTRHMAIDQEFSLSAMGIHRTRASFESEEGREDNANVNESIEHTFDFQFLSVDMLQDRSYWSRLGGYIFKLHRFFSF